MLTERLQKELEEAYAKGLRRTVDGLRFKTAVRAEDENGKEYLVFASNNYLGLTTGCALKLRYAPKMKTAKNILCLQAITTLGLPMRRMYSGLRQKRYAGEPAARAAALQQARRLKPADWKKNWRNLNTPKARWCSMPVT